MCRPLVAHGVNGRLDATLRAAKLVLAQGLDDRGARGDEDGLGEQAAPNGANADGTNTGLLVKSDESRSEQSLLNGVRPCACGDAPGVSAGARAPTRTASDDSRNSRRRSDNTMCRGTCGTELLNQTEANLPF